MKFRTDFVTNSSSANYTVSLELVSDNDKRAWSGVISACAEGDPGKELALRASYKGDLPTVTKDMTIDALCEMLFEGIVIEGCYYDNARSSDVSDDDRENREFVVTGKSRLFRNRDKLVEYIENLGGVVVESVSKNTDYLICNDKTSTSSKIKKAQDLNIPVISEWEFITRFGDPDDLDIDIDEDEEWDEDLERKDYNAKELYPDLLEGIIKKCKKKGIDISSLDKIIIREGVYASGDDPIWDDILDDEYVGEKRTITIYDAKKNCWDKITLIEGEIGNSEFRVLDQANASYVDLSPEDLQITEQEYKLLSIDDVTEKWARKRGLLNSSPSKDAQLSTIHFQCASEDINTVMPAFEKIFNEKWKMLVESKKKIFKECNVKYNPLTFVVTNEAESRCWRMAFLETGLS